MSGLKKIAVLTSGGDAPGMNAAVRAVTRAALAKGWEVFGVRNGFAGLVSGTFEPLAARDVGGIIQHGGTVLGSARCPEFSGAGTGARRRSRNLAAQRHRRAGRDRRQRLADRLGEPRARRLPGGRRRLHHRQRPLRQRRQHRRDTAINITLEAIDRLRTTASSHQRAFAVETMGRDCGYIALMAGIAGGAEVIALPEQEITPAQVAERLRAAYQRGKTHALVVIAEGAQLRRARADGLLRASSASRSASSCASRASATWCAAASPSAADRVLATRLGAAAVERLARGEHGVLVGILWATIAATPLAEVAGRTRPADAELLELARVMAM